MTQELKFFEILRAIIVYLNPIVFIYGFLLILYSNYKKLEDILSAEVIKTKISFVIDWKRYKFHEWLFERRTLFGATCVAYSVITSYLLLKRF